MISPGEKSLSQYVWHRLKLTIVDMILGEEEEEGRPKTVLPLLKRKVSATSDAPEDAVVKKPKKKTNVWTKTSTRKSSKKTKVPKPQNGDRKDECIEVNPSQRYQLEEKNGIQLSKV